MLKSLRRRRLLNQPFPDPWLQAIEENVAHWAWLTQLEREALLRDVRIFIAERHWEGCGGLEITGEMQSTIAAQACLLTLCVEHDFFPNVRTILVYPSSFYNRSPRIQDGVLIEGPELRSGEAWRTGSVILSWRDVLEGGSSEADGHNVVVHEFAHQLDSLDGDFQGTVRLGSSEEYDEWSRVMSAEFQSLTESGSHRSPALRSYAATNPAEFFAVAAEAFFERPRLLHRHHRELYALLRNYFRQDTCARELRTLRARRGMAATQGSG